MVYTSEIIEIDNNIPMWDEEFKQFIKDNNPANIGEGFISTKDIGDGFHDALWRYNELY